MTNKKTQTQIRPAGFQDAPAIFEIIKRNPEALVPRPIGDIIQNIDRFLVAEADGKIAGIVSWQILPEIGRGHSPTVEIQSLAVEEPYRRQGIGHALVSRAIEHVRVLLPAQIIALTFTPEFFANLGFKETPKENLMHKIYMGCRNCTRYDSPFTCPEKAVVLRIGNTEV
jgi:N-acetylglutamate synthase-like GNAT family acetyltransferase